MKDRSGWNQNGTECCGNRRARKEKKRKQLWRGSVGTDEPGSFAVTAHACRASAGWKQLWSRRKQTLLRQPASFVCDGFYPSRSAQTNSQKRGRGTATKSASSRTFAACLP